MLGEYSYSLLVTCAGVAYPLYQSFKALRDGSPEQWLPYWLVFALLSTINYPLDLIFSMWVPLYYELKLGFVVALQPETWGLAKTLYDSRLEPALVELDKKLADDATVALVQAGWKRFRSNPAQFLQEKFVVLKALDMQSAIAQVQYLTGWGREPSTAKAAGKGDVSTAKATGTADGFHSLSQPLLPGRETPPSSPELRADDAVVVDETDVDEAKKTK